MQEETSVQRIVKAKKKKEKEGVIDHLGATESEKFHRKVMCELGLELQDRKNLPCKE